MANTAYAKVEGGEELLKRLRKAGGNVRKALRAASKAGGEVFRTDAEARAPQIRYKKRLIVKSSFPKRDVCEVTVKIAKKAWYLKFFETGATAHEIKSSAKALAFEGDDGLVITKSLRHPGMAAAPFLRPAFDAKQGEAEGAVGDALRKAVEDAEIAQAAAEESDE